MPKLTKTDPESIEYALKIQQAIRARREGFSYAEIGKQLEMKPKTVQKAVSRALKDAVLDEVAELRALQYLRIESLIAPLMEKAAKGNLLAVDRLIKLFAREAALMGLDAPTKIAPTDSEGNDKAFGQVVFYLPDNGRDGLTEKLISNN